MERLFVYADFDWLNCPKFVGELSCDNIRGTQNYGFQFDKIWLSTYGNLYLSADLNNYVGWQFTKPGKDIFGCFSDCLPDRWGRNLLNYREQILAQEEIRPVKKLESFDYLIGVEDFTRMGAFRFKIDPNGDFINSTDNYKIPPITGIRDLIFASNKIEMNVSHNLLPDKQWIIQLLQHGTSLGGARPKAVVTDEKQQIYVAKFPSRNDDYDIGLWEHFCNKLAIKCGVYAAESKLLKTNSPYSTFLTKRFDRTTIGKRVHFASALSLLGLSDGDNASNGYGYLNIVDFMIRNCTNVTANLQELYRRVVFNICVGNTDDHFRNHGFLLTPKGWTLSPAFDMNPTLNNRQSLLINNFTNESDLNILLSSCEDYLIQKMDAQHIIDKVIYGIRDWGTIANQCHISKTEMERFAPKLSQY